MACALALVAACSSDDGNDPALPDATVPDAGPGVPPDARNDGGAEVPPDGGAEVPPDGGAEVPPDGGAEVPPDGGAEVPPDGGVEVPPDAAPAVPPDAAPDTQNIVASTDAVAVDEGGTATFTVRLSNDPSGPLQVTVASSDATAASVSPASLDFDSSSFAEPQTVTVTGVADNDLDSESVTVTLVGAGLVVPVAVAVADTTQPPYPVDMFVRGSFNGFEPDDALVFEGGVSYGALISLHVDVHELKVADAAFSPERTFSVGRDGPAAINLDLPTPLQPAAGTFNNTLLSVTDPGIYRFELEATDPTTPVLTVSLAEPATYLRDMYVRGSFGGFEPVDRMTYEGSGRHTALVSLSQGEHEFKISDQLFNQDATFSVSADGLTPIALDTPTPLEPAAGFSNNTALTISQPGVYLFDMDASDPAAPVLTITLAAPVAGSASSASWLPAWLGALPGASPVR
jgi:hypothetical protein